MSQPIAVIPNVGQESVWDYPRPPRVERVLRRIEIIFAGIRVVDASDCWRVLETSHPPVYYVSPEYVAAGVLVPVQGSSVCEWKGSAQYFDVVANDRVAARAAWCYPKPTRSFAPIAGFLAFYAGAMDLCSVDGEIVTPQAGGFYGGWITAGIVGPFKGDPGSFGW